MKHFVSKIRTKKTKSRERQASKASAEQMPLGQRASVGWAMVFALWAAGVFMVGFDNIFSPPSDPFDLLPLVGQGTFLLTGLFGTGLFFRLLKPRVLKQNSRILMLSLISLLAMVTTKTMLYLNAQILLTDVQVVTFLIPMSMVPLLVTILMGSRAGVIMGIWNSLTTALMIGNSFPVFLAGIVTTLVAAQTARNVRTRTVVIKTGLIVGLSKVTFVLAATACNWKDAHVSVVLDQAAACMVSGFFAAVIVLLILPFFESVFRITTNISLLELADLGHPLLQRLAIEAPGTYHHSLIVANLAQAAADEIGANSLLARICSYFHDIGKLTKPDFFSENIHLQDNPHDNLPPSMSTLVITAHVKEGLSLGVLHKLPPPIMNVIREHHGTSLLTFFHHKAKSQLEFELGQSEDLVTNGQTKLDEGDFRYPGPKPSSRESAIICLADAVEAASRSIKKITPGHIENLVTDIVFSRLMDGQLDDCDLTLEQLTRIRRCFVFTLTNMLHGRVPYPEKENENRDKQQAKSVQDQQQDDKGTDKADNVPGRAD